MPAKKSIFILGPDAQYNYALIAELRQMGLNGTMGENDLSVLKGLAKSDPPESILLNGSFVPGWGLDLLGALVILFPKAVILFSGKDLNLNNVAMRALGVHCYLDRNEPLKDVVEHIVECRKQFIKDDGQSNVC